MLFWSIALMAVCGKMVVSVNGDQGKIFTGVGSVGWTRKFKWSGIREVQENTRYGSKGGIYHVIVLEGDTRISFGSGIKESRLYFMENALRAMLRKR